MDLNPLWISIKTGIVSIIITFFLGIIVSYFVLRIKRESIRMLVDGFLTLPLVLPPTVMGFFLLYFFGNTSPLGKTMISLFGVKLTFSWISTVIAAIAISFPLMYRSSKAAFESVEEDMIYAAKTLGMHEWGVFTKVILPNAYPGLVSGTILAFARGLGEFGATAMIAGNIVGKTQTLPLKIYAEVASGHMERAIPYVWIILIICFIAVCSMNLYQLKVQRRRKNL